LTLSLHGPAACGGDGRRLDVGGGGAGPSPCAGDVVATTCGGDSVRAATCGGDGRARHSETYGRQRPAVALGAAATAVALGAATTGGGTDSSGHNGRRRRCSLHRGPPRSDFANCSTGEEGGGAAGLYTPLPPLVPVGGFSRD
jgi:hypothetical protein